MAEYCLHFCPEMNGRQIHYFRQPVVFVGPFSHLHLLFENIKPVAKFPQTETSTKTNFIISAIFSKCTAFVKQIISRFPNCGHFQKYLRYLPVWVKLIFEHTMETFFFSCLQTSLASLMTTLSQSHPYFVRCVKPNEKKVWNAHRQFI